MALQDMFYFHPLQSSLVFHARRLAHRKFDSTAVARGQHEPRPRSAQRPTRNAIGNERQLMSRARRLPVAPQLHAPAHLPLRHISLIRIKILVQRRKPHPVDIGLDGPALEAVVESGDNTFSTVVLRGGLQIFE